MHLGFLAIEPPFAPERGGGIAAYLRAVIPEYVRRGYPVTLIQNNPDNLPAPRRMEGVTVISVSLPSLHWYLSKIPNLGASLALLWREIEWSWVFKQYIAQLASPPEIVESSETGGLFLGKASHFRWIARLHGSAYFFQQSMGGAINLGARWAHNLQRQSWRQASMVTTPSRTHAKQVLQSAPELGGHIRVIPNPIQSDLLQAALATSAQARDSNLVLFVGRLAPVKGVITLLEAIRRVLSTNSQVNFILAGEWQMPNSPSDYGLGKSAQVQWLGHVSWLDLVDWYRRAMMVVIPSFYETFGLSAIEAAAFGKPVIATGAGGLPEVVEDGVTGILVPAADPYALAEGIIQLLRDPELCWRMGQAGREKVLASFTVERVVTEMLDLYTTVDANEKPP